MYEEKNNRFSMKDLVVQLLFVVLLVFILMYLFPSKQFIKDSVQPLYDRIFNENILMMKDGAKAYFTTPRLPQNKGDKVKLTLGEMLDKKIVLPFTDSSGKTCDNTASYVEVEKKDDEYVMKVNLKCGEQENYLLVYMGCYDYCKTTICEKNKEDVKTPLIQPAKPCSTCGNVTNNYINNIINNVVNVVKPDPEPQKYYCSVVNGKYYGKNGNEVDEAVYKAECTTEQKYYCSIVNGNYYDKAGNKVDKTAYEKDCQNNPDPVITYEYEYLKKTGGTCEWSNNWSDWTEKVLYPNEVTQVKTKTRTTTLTYKKVIKYKVTQYYDTSKPIYEKKKVQTGSYDEKKCSSYKTETVGTGQYKEEWVDRGLLQPTSDTLVNTATKKYELFNSYMDDCNNTCSSRLMKVYRMAELVRTEIKKEQTVCAKWTTKTIPTYGYIDEFVGFEIVTKREPVYGYVDEVVKTPLYASRTCTPKDGTTTIKWSTNKNDSSLLNNGYVLTGNKRQKK